jgi:SAM-dependent methyltransferase
MDLNHCLEFLQNPDSTTEAEFDKTNDLLLDKKTGKKYSIVHNMVNFQGTFKGSNKNIKKGLLFKLNTFYSNRLDPWIRTSIFAGGGISFIKTRTKMKLWISQFAKNQTLFIEPEDNRLISFIGFDKCLTVEDFSARNVLPSEIDYPNLNASPEQLPIRSASFQNIISNFVLEHVKNPRLHLQEVERILKPGGYVILGGPGDIYPSHRIPFNYFNIIRFGYLEMFRENKLELIEEYFPSKSWMSILYIIYSITVRNSLFNKNQFTKLLQMVVLGISLVISPFFNLLALLLDLVTPFDQRGYSVYLAVLRKPVETPSQGNLKTK